MAEGRSVRNGDGMWLSVRMRASQNGMHVSGAERLVPLAYGSAVVRSLLRRAESLSKRVPDEIVLTVDEIEAASIRYVPVLKARTVDVLNPCEGLRKSLVVLSDWGVSASAIDIALRLLMSGSSPDGGNMRGAAIVDWVTGTRLEPDQRRGIRVSCVDMTPADRAWFDGRFQRRFPTGRFRDALILASKAASLSSVRAEICWSDDPDYVAGYVASREGGYVRFPHMKDRGNPLGGRIYFVDTHSFDVAAGEEYLELQPVLVTITDTATLKEV